MRVDSFFDTKSCTFSYIISDSKTKKCAIIDPVLDYNIYTGEFHSENADKLLKFIKNNNLLCEWILETHVHADHVTAAYYLKNKLNSKIGIGKGVKKVIKHWKPIFNIKDDKKEFSKYFDKLFEDGEEFNVGNLIFKVINTPGHTKSCISYKVDNNIFVGDTLLMPESGTARTDFPGGSAEDLFYSIKKLYKYPEVTNIYVCHNYPKKVGTEKCKSSLSDHYKNNVLINNKTSKLEYIKARNELDKNRKPPRFIYPSLQMNIKSGKYNIKNSLNEFIWIPINYKGL